MFASCFTSDRAPQTLLHSTTWDTLTADVEPLPAQQHCGCSDLTNCGCGAGVNAPNAWRTTSIEAGSLLVSGCAFDQNSASVSGGGIALQDLPLAMQMARFTGITASGNNAGMFGGGVSLDRAAREVGIDRSSFASNSALSPAAVLGSEPRGGGIGAQFSAAVHVSSTVMVSHQADISPAIWSALEPKSRTLLLFFAFWRQLLLRKVRRGVAFGTERENSQLPPYRLVAGGRFSSWRTFNPDYRPPWVDPGYQVRAQPISLLVLNRAKMHGTPRLFCSVYPTTAHQRY